MQAAAPDAIDAVVLWVDGADPAHRAKLDRHLAQIGHRPHSARPTRFGSVGEVDYCIRSILKFAPFVRRIFVVTDAQVPPIFGQVPQWHPALRDKLVLVDHRDIFAGHEQFLPTFNNRSIETMLHRIPGLADQFVYFNDDFLLIKPITPQAFFDGGRSVLHGRFEAMPELHWTRRLRALWRMVFKPRPGALRASNTQAQALGARRAGARSRFLIAGHNPYPMRRTTLERYWQAHPEVFERNASFRLRDLEQFVPTSLAAHLEIEAGNAIVEPDDCCLYLKPASKGGTVERIAAGDADPKVIFACVQSLDEADEAERAAVLDWLARTTQFDTTAAPPVTT